MSKGYWIVSITITDEAPYQRYVSANVAIFDKWRGRFIVRGGRYETTQGKAGTRQVVIEFDSYDDAIGCYNSPEYQDAVAHLKAGASVAHFTIVEGVL